MQTLWISGHIRDLSGYGNLTKQITTGLQSLDMDVKLNDKYTVHYELCPHCFKDIHIKKPDDAYELIITPPLNLPNTNVHKKCIIFTMWETSRIPSHWADAINKAGLVLTPSDWGVASLRRSGVTIPIKKVALGYDHLYFNGFNEFPETPVFGTAATLVAGGIRKNTRYLADLFQMAFPNNEPVRLKIKLSSKCKWEHINDYRIQVFKSNISVQHLANWYKTIGVFINPSFCEGFGLHLLEAMASGRPVMSTNYSGLTEFWDEDVGYIIDHQLEEAHLGDYRTGEWAVPNEESLIEQMRYVYNNWQEAKVKGLKSAAKSQNYTWKIMGYKVYNIVKDFMR